MAAALRPDLLRFCLADLSFRPIDVRKLWRGIGGAQEECLLRGAVSPPA